MTLQADKDKTNSLSKAIMVLNSFSNERPRLKLKDISTLTGISQPTVYRLLATLKEHGLIEHSEGQYYLGKCFLRYEGIVLNSMTIRQVSLPFLEELASVTKANINLAILDGDEVLYIARVETVATDSGYFHVGMRRPVYCSALGKALICNNPEKADEIFGHDIRRYTLSTIVDKDAFLAEIEQTRLRGYASDFEEWSNGVNCIASPVYDVSEQIVAAVGMSAPTSVFPAEEIGKYAPFVIECANRLSRRLGSQQKGF